MSLTSNMKVKLAVLMSIAALTGASIWHQLAKPQAHKSHSAPVAVEVDAVKRQDLEQTIQVMATVQAYATVAIKSRVEGILARVYFLPGKDVAANEPLFQIDDQPFNIALQQAKADLARDQAQLDNAKQQLARYSKLIDKGFVSQDIYNKAQSDVNVYSAAVAASKAKLASAQLQLDYCTIRAPISGKTSNVIAQSGNLIKVNDSVPLVIINQISPVDIDFAVPEQYLPAIQQSMANGPVAITARINGDWVEQGQLASINNEIDTTTGTVKLKGTFANSSNRLWPGQYVTVGLPIAKFKQAIVLPSRAVQQGQQGHYVYVVKDQRAEYRAIKIGAMIKGQTIVLSGVQPGETVVVDGQFRLAQGTPVSVKQAQAE